MSFFRRKSLFIILLGFILVVMLIGYSVVGKEKLTKPEQFIVDSISLVQTAVYKPITALNNTFSKYKNLQNAHNENILLKEKLAESKTLLYEKQDLEVENKELRDVLELVESNRDFNPIKASVISRSPEQWLEQVTINKGESHGVKAGMAVITADGMVGRIKSTAKISSTMQLLTGFDQFNRISATVINKKGDKVFGLIEQYDVESEALIFRIIEDSDKQLKEGEIVVSSNMGGSYPSGLTIGEIKEVIPDQYGLTKTALVTPAADIQDLDNVIIVDRTLMTKEEAKGENK